MNLIMEKDSPDGMETGEEINLGLKTSTGCFFKAFPNLGEVIGEAYPGFVSDLKRLRRWPVTCRNFFQQMDMPDKARLSVYDVTILDDGKIVTQQMSITDDLAGTSSCGSNTPSANTGIDLQIDNEPNLSTRQLPLLEGRTKAADADDFLDYMFDCFLDASLDQWPSIEEIAAAAGVNLCSPLITSDEIISAPEEPTSKEIVAAAAGERLCSPLIAGYEIISAPGEPTGKEIVASSGDDFFKFLESCEHDILASQVAMPALVTGNDGVVEGSVVKDWKCSFPYRPDGNDGVGGSGVKDWEYSSPFYAVGNDGVGGSRVKFWECSSPYQPYGNDGVGGRDGVKFWECPSPYPPNFGASFPEISRQPVDASLAECAPFPDPFMFELYSPHMQAHFPSPPEDIATLLP